MKTRSKSLAKIPSFDIVPKSLYSIKSIHEKETNRVYGEKSSWMMRKPSYISIVSGDCEKLPDMYKRNDKSFDKISQSSPATRIQKLKEARFFRHRRCYLKGNSKLSIGSNCQNAGFDDNENEVSSLRRQKSFDIVRQVSQAVIKEKENGCNLKKLSQDFSDIIQLKTKAIRKHIEGSSERRDKKFNSLLVSQKRLKSKKRILVNIN